MDHHEQEHSVVIRRATRRDIEKLRRLMQLCFKVAYEPIMGKQRVEAVSTRALSRFNLWSWYLLSAISPTRVQLFVADLDGGIIGEAGSLIDEKGEIVLYTLHVHPDWQSRGIGSALLDAVAASCPTARTMRLEVLEANAPSIAFYERRGFNPLGRTDNATATTGIPALYMDKLLDPAHPPAKGNARDATTVVVSIPRVVSPWARTRSTA